MLPAFLGNLIKAELVNAARSAATSAGKLAVRESGKVAKRAAISAVDRTIKGNLKSGAASAARSATFFALQSVFGKFLPKEAENDESISSAAKKASPFVGGNLFSSEDNDPQFVEWMKQQGFSEKQIAETMAGRKKFRTENPDAPVYSTAAASAAPSSAKASIAIPDWMANSIVPDDGEDDATFYQAMKDDGFTDQQIAAAMARNNRSMPAQAQTQNQTPAPAQPQTHGGAGNPPPPNKPPVQAPPPPPPNKPPVQSPPPPPPPPKPPGGPTGQPPQNRFGLGWLQKLGSAFRNFTNNLSGFTKVVGIGALGMVGLATSLATVVRRVERFSLAMSESNRSVARYNSQLASSFAELDRNRLRRDIETAQVTSASAKFANKGQDYLESELRPFENAAQNIGNLISGAVSHATAWSIDMAGKVTGIEWTLEKIEQWLGKGDASNPIGNTIHWLARQKDEPRKVGPQQQNHRVENANAPLRMNQNGRGGKW